MISEEKIIISFIFKRSGRKKMTSSEIYLPMSMELKWCTPNQAKKFVEKAVQKGFLTKENDLLKPAFPFEEIPVPFGFKPSENFFELKKDENKKFDKTEELLDLISSKSGRDKNVVIDEIKKIERQKNLTFKVAALLEGKKYDIDLRDFYEDAENGIIIGNKK